MRRKLEWGGALVVLCAFAGGIFMPPTGIVTTSPSFSAFIGICAGIGIVLLIDLAAGRDLRKRFVRADED